jgi:hypothetical protein
MVRAHLPSSLKDQRCVLVYVQANSDIGCEKPSALVSSFDKWIQGEKELRVMAVIFPNHSRSYDSSRHAVRFWGYDSAMETSFFITAAALQRLDPSMPDDEARLFSAFDRNRGLIYETAARVYLRGSKGSYELTENDFVRTDRRGE